MSELVLLLYLTCVGFALAGLTKSAIQLWTGRTLGFSLVHTDGPLFVPGLLARLFAGPVILLRNGWVLAGRDNRPSAMFLLTIAISAAWSFFSGLMIVSLFV
jgi:hypothetical protein